MRAWRVMLRICPLAQRIISWVSPARPLSKSFTLVPAIVDGCSYWQDSRACAIGGDYPTTATWSVSVTGLTEGANLITTGRSAGAYRGEASGPKGNSKAEAAD